MGYEETMQAGAARYGDVTEMLRRDFGVAATFTQTGGMCAAIEMMLETGAMVLVTSADDSLPWDRAALTSWGVGVYAPNVGCCSDTEPCHCVDSAPAGWAEVSQAGYAALFATVSAALRDYVGVTA